MAWKWYINKVTYEGDGAQIGVEVKIYRDTWTLKDKIITRYWQFGDSATATVANLTVLVQAEVDAYQALKQSSNDLAALLGVEQSLV